MKMQRRFNLAGQSLLLLASIFLLSVAGGIPESLGLPPACAGWPFCLSTDLSGWLRIAHVLFAGASAALMLWLFTTGWTAWRRSTLVLPLVTVAAVVFLGQSYVGALQVLRGFPEHLVVLHSVSAVSVWIALIALVAVALRMPAREELPASLPARDFRDFISLGKPWIVALLLVTTLGGLVLGGHGWPSPTLAFWTLMGGGLAAAGSSALNQYIDRDLDARMQRTSRRPIPSGRLTPAEALSYGLALCLASYYVLATLVNLTAALLSLAGILYYVVFYSILLKRATDQNIVIGGGAGAIPPMVGWAAAAGHLSLPAWILFLIIFMWTPPHFWALAIVRSKDYERAGVPMLPVLRGEEAARRQILIYTVLLVGSTFLLPLVGAAGALYFVAACVLGLTLIRAAWLVWRLPGNKTAWSMYRWSSLYLMFIFLALVLDALV